MDVAELSSDMDLQYVIRKSDKYMVVLFYELKYGNFENPIKHYLKCGCTVQVNTPPAGEQLQKKRNSYKKLYQDFGKMG